MSDRRKHFLPYRAYIVCNLLIVLVPMVAVVALFLSGMHSQMRDEVLDMRRTNLRHALDTIDQTLENFGSMALYASLDDDLRPYQLRKNDYDAITALNHLKQHAASQSDMSIYLHIRSEECLYSPDGRLDFSTFELIYSFEGGWSAQDFYALLDDPHPYATSPAGCTLCSKSGHGTSYIAVLYPWAHSGINYGTAIGLIETQWFEERLRSAESDVVYAFDAEGRFSMSSTGDEFPFDAKLVSERADSAVLDGELYYLIWQDSTLNGWSYVTAIPARYIVSLLFGDHVLLFAVVFVLAIAFATVGAALAVRYYMPIQNLARLLSDDTDQPQRVHDSVSRILRNNEDMRMELEETQGYLVQELLAQLIWGGANREETSSRLRRFGLALNGPVHAALTVSLGGASPHDTEAAIAALQDEGMLVTEAHDGGQIVLL